MIDLWVAGAGVIPHAAIGKGGGRLKFKLTIINPDKIIYEGEVENVFLCGDKGEFELLPYHAPLISILREGEILVNKVYSLNIYRGLVRFYNNECVILAEEKLEFTKAEK